MKIEESHNADDVVPLLEHWYEVCRADEFGFDVSVERTRDDLDRWLREMVGTMFVARADKPLGFIAVFKVPSSTSGQMLGLEKYWYADPNHKMVGPKLYLRALDWCEANGCTHMILAASNVSSHHFDNIVRFCEHQGFQEFERSYIVPIGAEHGK